MYRIVFLLLLITGSLMVSGQGYEEFKKSADELYKAGSYAEAIPFAIKAKEAAGKKFGIKSAGYATSINNVAFLYKKTGNYTNAISLYKQVLTIRKEVLGEAHPHYAECLHDLGTCYFRTGNYKDAEPLFKQALSIREKISDADNYLYINYLNDLAELYRMTGNYAAAEPLYVKAMTLGKKTMGSDDPDYGSAVSNLGILYMSMGNYEGALPLLIEAMAIDKKAFGTESLYYAADINNLAFLYKEIADYPAAETLYKEALTIVERSPDKEESEYSTSVNNLAGLYMAMGNYAAAEPLYKAAMDNDKKTFGTDHPYYAADLNNLAELYSEAGNYTKAETNFKESLGIYKRIFGDTHPEYGSCLSNLAMMYEKMGNYDTAAALFVKSTRIAFDQVKNNFSTLSEAEKIEWADRKKGDFQVLPSLLFTRRDLTGDFIRKVCTQQLQMKGLIVNDGSRSLRQARQSNDLQLLRLLTYWQNNKSLLAKQYSLPVAERIPQMDSLEKEVNKQEKQINQQSSVFHASQQDQQIGFAEVQQQLKKDEAAVEFIRFQYFHQRWTDSVFYAAFIILPGDTIPHFVPLCAEKQLAGILDSKTNSSKGYVQQLYRSEIADDENTVTGKKGDSLYNLIWKPLLPFLENSTKVAIAPAGLLNRIAFNALPSDSNHFIIDSYQLRQYSSVREIAAQKNPVAKTASTIDAVLYGDIQFTIAGASSTKQKASSELPGSVKRNVRGSVWNPLPGTLQEVNIIKRLFDENKKETQVITGANATEENFKQLSGHSPVILHLATHGFSLPDAEQKKKNNLNNSNNPFALADNPLMRSGIIMAGANRVWQGDEPVAGKEDGIVTAYEIADIDLSNTELVVLSACETALGDIRGTEGVFGLQRAFKLAGVRNMILSLWQVPDAETAELMNILYSNKLKGMTTYDAFNKAQDMMRKKYSPFYWAAFVLIE